MAIEIKRFNWRSKPTAWEHAQAWNAQRKAMTQRFIDDGNAAATAFTNAQTSLSVGLATISTQAMIERVQKEIAASAQSQLGQLDLLV